MHLFIETTRGSRLTFTSATHNAEKRARPGVKAVTTQEPKSTSIVEDAYSIFSRRSLGLCDTKEEACAEPSCSPPPSRTRSFRKTFRWFRVHFSRASHPEHRCPPYNEEAEALPPYHKPRSSELHSSTLQELPGETPEMFGQETFHELVGYSVPLNVQGCAMDSAEDPYFGFESSEISKWEHTDMAYYDQRARTPLHIPTNPSNMVMAPQQSAVPEMTRQGSSGSSAKSPPISPYPYTPGRDGNYAVEDPYRPGFVTGMVSPQEAAPPNMGVYAADGHNFDTSQGYSSVQASSRPIDSGSAEIPSPPVPGLYPSEAIDFPYAPESYQETGGTMLHSQESGMSSGELHHGLNDPRLGTWEGHGSMWYRQRTHIEEAEDTIDEGQLLNQQIRDGLQQEGYVDSDQHQSSQQKSPPTTKPTYLPVACNICGTQFNGRYRMGNLRRHLNGLHNQSRSKAGMTCRVCRQEYNRADAARKHERIKHKFFDAMHTTRRRGKAPAAMY